MKTVFGQSYVQIKVEDELLDAEQVAMEYVAMRSHRRYGLPTLDMSLIDLNGYLAKKSIAEGSKISVLMARTQNNNVEWVDFRVFAITPVPLPVKNTGTKYVISGYYDFPSFLYSRIDKNYADTSAKVYAGIITACPTLTAVIDSTNDRKGWRCNGKTAAEFIRNELLPHSYVDDESFMMSGVSDSRKAYYVNASRIVKDKPKFKLVNTSEIPRGEYDAIIEEYSYNNDVGLYSRVAKGLKSFVFDLTQGAARVESEIKAVKTDGNLSPSKDLMTTAKRIFSPLEIGNTDSNHYLAKTRNTRVDSLYSVQMEVLVKSFTGIDLFDFVDVKIVEGYEKPKLDTRVSGRYIVEGRARVATQTEYAEKLCLVRNGENLEDNKSML